VYVLAVSTAAAAARAGTLWKDMPNKCASTCDVYAAGNVSECVASDKAVELGLPGPLLVENVGTANDGTYCGHWSEAQLKNELMTGALSPLFLYNPLSAITIGGLKVRASSCVSAQ
jgi:hypothetical protein